MAQVFIVIRVGNTTVKSKGRAVADGRAIFNEARAHGDCA